ncbi:copper chaperone PCu(A)C [Comamonadaceae bacterium OH2545_COT-014]|nr:copper chaperone PCu(A)C [Comamonadaceae bacterium OH2545_COT-014]
MFRFSSVLAALPLAALLATGHAWAQDQAVHVSNAWVRASVPGQKATGVFMTLKAPAASRLVGVASPVAGVSEIHEMVMQGDVMKMRAMPGLDLPAGKDVTLKPGGLHLMLMDLKAPLAAGTQVPVTLTFEHASGQPSQQTLQVPVRPLNTAADGAAGAHRHAPAHKH